MSEIAKLYRSSDPGAPVLNGQPGSLAAVLDAVLVDGYGSGPSAKEPLGWLRAFSGTNKRAYRNDPALHSGQFLRIDDGQGRFALIDGYESMSSADAGSVRFDTVSSAWTKSNQADSSPRDWYVVGTSASFYVSFSFQPSAAQAWFAGDYIPLNPQDISRFGYSVSAAASYAAGGGLFFPSLGRGLRVSRASSGLVGSGHLLYHRLLMSGSGNYGSSGFSYPLPTTNGIFLERALLNENSQSAAGLPRGVMPGVWAPDHNVAALYENGSVYSGFADLPGTQLLAIKNTQATPNVLAFVDLTNPW